MVDSADSEAQLQDAVARADRARRGRETALRLWALAPLAAAACFLVAIGGRVAGWTPFVTLFVLAAGAVALAGFVVAARRHRDVSDAEVAHLDADAGLHGELRSAHWFASLPAGAPAKAEDDWIRFHLARAAERARGVDWAALYPPPAAGRAKLATGLLAVAAVALAVLIPGRAGVAASDGRAAKAAAAAKRPAILVAIPPELRKQLEQMLTMAETSAGRALTAAEVRDLLARLDELAHRDPAKQGGSPASNTPGEKPATEADIKAYAERAKKASESTSLEPEVRDALKDMADKLNEADQNANAMSSRDPQDAAAAKDASGEAQASKSGSGKQDSASAQSVKEAAGGSAVGMVMMTTDDASNARDGGLGLGGGSADKNGGGHLADLGAALKKETIDASVDNAGENVQTTERRKTEQAHATTAYSHAASAPAERGSSTAPPPVPEKRRAAVKSYFIRKQ
jgi:hypothetical protein